MIINLHKKWNYKLFDWCSIAPATTPALSGRWRRQLSVQILSRKVSTTPPPPFPTIKIWEIFLALRDTRHFPQLSVSNKFPRCKCCVLVLRILVVEATYFARCEISASNRRHRRPSLWKSVHLHLRTSSHNRRVDRKGPIRLPRLPATLGIQTLPPTHNYEAMFRRL